MTRPSCFGVKRSGGYSAPALVTAVALAPHAASWKVCGFSLESLSWIHILFSNRDGIPILGIRPARKRHCRLPPQEKFALLMWFGGGDLSDFKSPFGSWEPGVFIKRNETHHYIRILYQRHARDQWLWFKELSLPVLVSRWGCVWANLIAHRRWLWRAAVLESCSRGLQTRSGCPGRGRAESAEYLLLDPRPTLGPAQLASPSPGRNNDHCMQHSPAALQQLHTPPPPPPINRTAADGGLQCKTTCRNCSPGVRIRPLRTPPELSITSFSEVL